MGENMKSAHTTSHPILIINSYTIISGFQYRGKKGLEGKEGKEGGRGIDSITMDVMGDDENHPIKGWIDCKGKEGRGE
jgi:hypothetical protein